MHGMEPAKIEPNLSDMSGDFRKRVINWARIRVDIPHDSPARDAAILLLDLVAVCEAIAALPPGSPALREAPALCGVALFGNDHEKGDEDEA